MQCFPQLLTGASSQYPIRKRNTTRTIVNQCLDGREIKLVDAGASSIDWQLTFQELADGERSTLEDFFTGMEGSLGTFMFLDPTDNLLAWSEKFDEAAWQRDPLLQVSGGVRDPMGGEVAFRVTNPSGAPLRLVQTLNVPGSYYYGLSLYARSGAAETITLHRGDQTSARAIGPGWNRLVYAAGSSSTADAVAFGIEIPSGGTVDLFGMQVEAQIGASGYKKTTAIGGIYTSTRFRDNILAFTSVGPGRHGCVMHLRTN